jgi:hypothetical protein
LQGKMTIGSLCQATWQQIPTARQHDNQISLHGNLRWSQAGKAPCGRLLVVHQHLRKIRHIWGKDISDYDGCVIFEALVRGLYCREQPSAGRLHAEQHTTMSAILIIVSSLRPLWAVFIAEKIFSASRLHAEQHTTMSRPLHNCHDLSHTRKSVCKPSTCRTTHNTVTSFASMSRSTHLPERLNEFDYHAQEV